MFNASSTFLQCFPMNYLIPYTIYQIQFPVERSIQYIYWLCTCRLRLQKQYDLYTVISQPQRENATVQDLCSKRLPIRFSLFLRLREGIVALFGMLFRYKPFSEIYGAATTEKHRPSLSTATNGGHGIPFNPTKQTAKNVDVCIK